MKKYSDKQKYLFFFWNQIMFPPSSNAINLIGPNFLRSYIKGVLMVIKQIYSLWPWLYALGRDSEIKWHLQKEDTQHLIECTMYVCAYIDSKIYYNK